MFGGDLHRCLVKTLELGGVGDGGGELKVLATIGVCLLEVLLTVMTSFGPSILSLR